MFKRLFVLSIFLIMFSCASSNRLNMPSGRPEATILGTSADVKLRITEAMLDRGFILASETDSRLVFTKPLKGGESFAYQMFYSGAYDTPPEWDIIFNFVDSGKGAVRVVGRVLIRSQSEFGQIRIVDLSTDKAGARVQNLLDTIRRKTNENR